MKLDLKKFSKDYKRKIETMSLEEYFDLASRDSSMYSTAAERLLKAIGKPKVIDTATDPRMSRLFNNRTIKLYEPFKDFYGLEEVVEKIVSYLEHSAQGLEERKQILYLLGPVGGGKSSLSEKLKELMEKEPFYAIKGSPLNESPLGLLRLFPKLRESFKKIPESRLPACASPWLVKRVDELDGDISQLEVIKLYPSQHRQVAVTKTEPGDENNQDISTLVGKLDIRKLEHHAQDDPDAYRFNGGLCLGNRGILEFVEMFKAPLKVLHPLLTATQEGNYKATEALSSIPFEGLILAHSNESEWQSFKDNKSNEAFLDRVYIVKVPYCLRYTEEEMIYNKYINESIHDIKKSAPHTLSSLAKFSVLSRLEPVAGDKIVAKLEAYNGDSMRDKYADKDLSLTKFRDNASLAEGFSGTSTRTAFKILSKCYNFDTEERAANPVHLFHLLKEYIRSADADKNTKELHMSFLDSYLIPDYVEELRKDIQICYLDSYSEYGQAIFEKYIAYADAWIEDHDYRDPDTGQIYDRSALNKELETIEKPAGISNPKDFRHEVVTANLRYAAKNAGKSIPWVENTRIKEVLEKKLFNAIDEILPQLSFEKEGDEKAENFIKRMKERGYTQRQARLVVKFFEQHMKESS